MILERCQEAWCSIQYQNTRNDRNKDEKRTQFMNHPVGMSNENKKSRAQWIFYRTLNASKRFLRERRQWKGDVYTEKHESRRGEEVKQNIIITHIRSRTENPIHFWAVNLCLTVFIPNKFVNHFFCAFHFSFDCRAKKTLCFARASLFAFFCGLAMMFQSHQHQS